MAIADWQFQINGLTIGQGTPYLIMDISGLGQPDVRDGDVDKSQEDGAWYGTDTYGKRTVELSVDIVGQTPRDALDLLRSLSKAWQLNGADTAALQFQMPGGVSRTVHGRPRKLDNGDLTTLKTRHIPMKLLFVAADPLIYSDAQDVQATFAAALPGRTYPRTFNVAYGGGSSGSVTFTNDGSYPTKPTIAIHGPCVNPFVENSTTGRRVSIGITLTADDVLYVDMGVKAVTLNGTTASRRSSVRSNPQWWTVVPGDNILRFGADSGTGSYAVFTVAAGDLVGV